MIALPQKTNHWYLNGNPFYELDGKQVTLREARKVKAFPSVTSILSAIHKPQLEAWKITNAILSSLTLPPMAGETQTEFASRAAKDAQQQTKDAMGLGSKIHGTAEEILLGKPISNPTEWDAPLVSWINENISNPLLVEKVVMSELGYGGKLDFVATIKDHGLCVCDFKTQNVKNDKPGFYDEFPLQLVAYQQCLNDLQNTKLASIIISTSEPGKIYLKVYDPLDYPRYFVTFLAAFTVWKFINKYDPIA